MRKRARIQTQDDDEPGPLAAARNQAGDRLRMFLLDRFTMGSLPGSDVAELCHWITQAGGVGVSELGLRPDQAAAHGHRRIYLHAGKIFPEPDLAYIKVPLFEKRESRRTAELAPLSYRRLRKARTQRRKAPCVPWTWRPCAAATAAARPLRSSLN